ncbi:uncharacterized protein LOC143735222 [Siphateles boraxobius]|uniref:uncharacterized protein LOC143735222 n=1 Tax=Siphateles boraxobius TaxID=180520 RepID=UPI004063AB65
MEIREGNDILWKYGAEKSQIAKIKKKKQNFSTFDVPDGRFRDRLKLDDQTGSLTITNTTTEHTGDYKLEIRGANLTSIIFSVSVYGVFGDSVSVMEGDSVTLNTDLTEIRKGDDILWKYGAENSTIAKINQKKRTFSIYNITERFRDRLKLDDQTGSLIIANTTTEHTGVYKLLITGAKLTSKSFSVSVYARLPVPVIISRNSSQCSSSSSSSNCSLVCSSVLNVSDVTLSWYAGISVLSSISVCDLSISLSLPLEVEYQDKNTYSCVLNNPISNQTTHLDINTLCHTCAVPPVSVSLIVLISAGSLIIVAVIVIFWICRKHRKTHKDVETCEVEITYAETKFNKRNTQKSKVEEEVHVEYAPITFRR